MGHVRSLLVAEIPVSHFRHVRIVLDIQIAPSLLGPHESDDDQIGIHAAHEYANDLPVVVSLDRLAVLNDRVKRETFADRRLDRR